MLGLQFLAQCSFTPLQWQIIDDPEIFRVNLLRHGRPHKEDEKGVDKDMCIAVEPNEDSRNGRKPLQLKRPLPPAWGGCYHSAFDSLFVRIPDLPEDAKPYEISHREVSRHGETIGDDLKSRNKHLHNYRVVHGLVSHDVASRPPDISYWSVNDEAIMVIRIHHSLDILHRVPDPTDLVNQQWDLVKKQACLHSDFG